MTRTEALQWLHMLKWQFNDSGRIGCAWEAADAECVLGRFPPLPVNRIPEWVETKYGTGKRWHIRLVLSTPYTARVLATLKAILLSIEDEPTP